MNAQNNLYKIRSVRGCLKAASELYVSNFKTIFHHSWLSAMVFALAATFSVLCWSHLTTIRFDLSWVLLFFAGCLSCLIAFVWLKSVGISLLRGNRVQQNFFKVSKQTVLICILSALYFLVALISARLWIPEHKPSAQVGLPQIIWYAFLFAIYIYITLPLCYTSMKYYIESKQSIKTTWCKNYRGGFRFEGYLFLTCLLLFIINTICYIIMATPALIMFTAQNANLLSLQMGDPDGLPSSFYILLFSSNFLCYFLFSYAIIWTEFVLYYIYGTIDGKREAMTEMKIAGKL